MSNINPKTDQINSISSSSNLLYAGPSTITSAATGPGGTTTSQACAACKYQRRKCAPNCLLAPYFPADKKKQFLNAHKLFGVSNIVKVIKSVPKEQVNDAVNCMIFQANRRAIDPVGGCSRLIQELERRLHLLQTELDFVYHQLDNCRKQALWNEVGYSMPETVDQNQLYDAGPSFRVPRETLGYATKQDVGAVKNLGYPTKQDAGVVKTLECAVNQDVGAVKVEKDKLVAYDESEAVKPLLGDMVDTESSD